jgi:D-alanyl-D-alanine carboxypeptidase
MSPWVQAFAVSVALSSVSVAEAAGQVAETAPATSRTASNQSADGTPVAPTPVSRTPVSATPVSATPASATPVSATPAGAFDAYMRGAVERENFSGTVLVAQNGVPIFQASYGAASLELGVPNTDRSVYHIQSITKPFTAILIMMLQEEGALKVEDPACNYLTDCPDAWRGITIHQLLTHTSGIEGYSRLADWDDVLDARLYWRAGAAWLVRDRPLRFSPGEGFRYSNSGYGLLGLIAERVAGKPLADLYRERIFRPLGMNQTGMNTGRFIVPGLSTGYYSLGSTFIAADPQSPTAVYGAAGITSTVSDLLLWDQALRSDTLISRPVFERMIAHTENDYAYGWEVRTWFGRRQIGHAGSGFGYSSFIARFIDDGLTVIVLSNSDAASAGGVARSLAAIHFGQTPSTPTTSKQTLLIDAVVAGGAAEGLRRYAAMEAAQPEDDAFKTDELLVAVGYELLEGPRMDDARAVFEFTLTKFPNSAYSHDGLADIAAAEGDIRSAIGHFEASLAIAPSNDYAVRGLERLRRQSGT